MGGEGCGGKLWHPSALPFPGTSASLQGMPHWPGHMYLCPPSLPVPSLVSSSPRTTLLPRTQTGQAQDGAPWEPSVWGGEAVLGSWALGQERRAPSGSPGHCEAVPRGRVLHR